MYEYRYRDHACGITHVSLKRAKKNLHKIGKIISVKGYRFISTRKYESGPVTTDHECVLIRGENGTFRLSGVLWGYGGTGPCALVQILKACGLNENAARAIAFNTKREYDQKTGIAWEFKFPVPVESDDSVISL